MKKLLFVTTRLFWPIDSGRKTSLYFYCKGLHEKYGYDIYLYSFLEAGQSENLIQHKPDFIKEIKLAATIGKGKKLANLFGKSLLCGWPFQNAIYYSGKNKRDLKKYCAELKPEIIIVDMIRLAPYINAFKTYDCIKILDLDDMLSKRYERQAVAKNAKGSILGANAQITSKTSNKFINQPFLKKTVLKSESRRTQNAELKYAKLYDYVIFVSNNETYELNHRLNQKKAITIPLGIDYSYFDEFSSVPKEKGALAFLGNMKVSANVDSLNLIVTEVLPKLRNDIKFYIIGTCSENLKKQFSDPRLIFCGMVEDVRPILGKCEVFLSPIAYGTGIKTKILEAMALGLPVVTNSVGIEGIAGISGKHYLVSDDNKTLAEYVDELLSNREKADQLALNGKLLVKELYDWKNIYASFSEVGIS